MTTKSTGETISATTFNNSQKKMVIIGGNGAGVADIDLGVAADNHYGIISTDRVIRITAVTSIITEVLLGAGSSAAIPLLKYGSTTIATGPTLVNGDTDAVGIAEAWTISNATIAANTVIFVASGVSTVYTTGQFIVVVEFEYDG